MVKVAETKKKAEEERFPIHLIKGRRYSLRKGDHWRTIVAGQVVMVNAAARNYLMGQGYFADYIPESEREPDLLDEVDEMIPEQRDDGGMPLGADFEVMGEIAAQDTSVVPLVPKPLTSRGPRHHATASDNAVRAAQQSQRQARAQPRTQGPGIDLGDG
jgi:hypothetical protein